MKIRHRNKEGDEGNDKPSDFRIKSPIRFIAPFSLPSVESTCVERSSNIL